MKLVYEKKPNRKMIRELAKRMEPALKSLAKK